jgi:hypothetical protein
MKIKEDSIHQLWHVVEEVKKINEKMESIERGIQDIKEGRVSELDRDFTKFT